jgi:hypothetical protein
MPSVTRILLATALLAVPAIARPALAEPIAVMVAVKGKVGVTPAKGGKQVTAGLGQRLERGDRVQVGAGGAVTLFFSDGNVIELAEKSTVTVSGKVTAAQPKAAVPTEVFAKVTRFVASDAKSAGVMALAPMRGAGDDGAALALSPRHTQVRSGRPSFRWSSVPGATRYHVVVAGDAGDVWARDVPDTTLDYPSGVAALAGGAEYLWSVEARSEAGSLGKDESPFSVMSDAQSKRVTADLEGIERATAGAAAHYLAGSYLVGQGLYGDATERFTALILETPGVAGASRSAGHRVPHRRAHLASRRPSSSRRAG